MIRANFDYEIELFTGKKASKTNQEFEYLYWWTDTKQGALSTELQYSQDYLDYIQEILKAETELSRAEAKINWWGELNNIPLEKLLNSKLTSSSFAIEENLCHPLTKIITEISELKFVPDEDYVLKNPYLMSGKGFMRFTGKDFEGKAKAWTEKQLKENPLIFEPWLKKLHDVSSYLDFEKQKIETYFNLSNDQGNYKGTVVYADPTMVFQDIEERSLNLDYYLESLEHIRTHYQKLGANKGMSIDSFTYQDQDIVKTYYLSEVNYRKTMGWVALSLKKFLADQGIGQLYMKKRTKEWSSFSDYKNEFSAELYNETEKKGILLLSPQNKQFMTFFIVAPNKEELENYLFKITNL